MRLTVLGASGGIGKWVVLLALERGYHVRAIIRDSSSYLAPEGVVTLRGEVTDINFIQTLDLKDEVVISCIGQRRANLLPWSRLLSPKDLVQRVSENLIQAKPQSLLWVSAAGVGASATYLTTGTRFFINRGHIATAYADLEKAEDVLVRAAFPHFAVRPVTLTHGTSSQKLKLIKRYGLNNTIHRRSVASWLLEAAERF